MHGQLLPFEAQRDPSTRHSLQLDLDDMFFQALGRSFSFSTIGLELEELCVKWKERKHPASGSIWHQPQETRPRPVQGQQSSEESSSWDEFYCRPFSRMIDLSQEFPGGFAGWSRLACSLLSRCVASAWPDMVWWRF